MWRKNKFSTLLGLGRDTYISMLSQSLTKRLNSLQNWFAFVLCEGYEGQGE